MKPIRLLALDPATHVTGYAYFEGEGEDFFLLRFGLVGATKSRGRDIRCMEICGALTNLLIKRKVTELVYEYPEYQQGNRGYTAARRGNTLDLAFLCGCLFVTWNFHQARVMTSTGAELDVPTEVRPHVWKGQEPKDVTARKCLRKYGVKAETNKQYNYTDAVMIGDWFLLADRKVQARSGSGCKREDL